MEKRFLPLKPEAVCKSSFRRGLIQFPFLQSGEDTVWTNNHFYPCKSSLSKTNSLTTFLKPSWIFAEISPSLYMDFSKFGSWICKSFYMVLPKLLHLFLALCQGWRLTKIPPSAMTAIWGGFVGGNESWGEVAWFFELSIRVKLLTPIRQCFFLPKNCQRL